MYLYLFLGVAQPAAFDIDAIRASSEMNFDTLPTNAIGRSILYNYDKWIIFSLFATLKVEFIYGERANQPYHPIQVYFTSLAIIRLNRS